MGSFITRLEAVNEMLADSGFHIVSSLTPSGPANAKLAEAGLDRSVRETLKEGFWFNRETDVTWSPNTSDEIPVPLDILAFRATDGSEQLIELQGKVFSKVGHSSTFTSDITVDVIYDRSFDGGDIPYVAQNLIVKAAKLRFQMSRVGDIQLRLVHVAELAGARIALDQEEGDKADFNSLAHHDLAYVFRPPKIGMIGGR